MWARRDGDVEFFPFPMLTSQEVVMVLYGIEERIERLFRRKNYIRGHGPDIDEVPEEEVPAPFMPRQPWRHVAKIPRWLCCLRRGGAHLDY